MIQITLKIRDKEDGTPGEVCELIQKLIEDVPGDQLLARFEVEEAKASTIAAAPLTLQGTADNLMGCTCVRFYDGSAHHENCAINRRKK